MHWHHYYDVNNSNGHYVQRGEWCQRGFSEMIKAMNLLIDHKSSNYQTPDPVNKSDQTYTVCLDSKRQERTGFK